MTFTQLTEALDWLYNQRNSKRRENLDMLKEAMAFFGNPHKDLPVIHITGTNGKGSTSNFLKDLFLSQGLSVASFTSPHIERFNERISLNGEAISDAELLDLINKMLDCNHHMQGTGHGRLNFFELCTVMMALFCKSKEPDICLIEVGIGGRLDSTNIFDGEMAVITSVGLDHEAILGHSLSEVAQDKAGIIKEGAKVFIGDLKSEAIKPIKKKAKAEAASLHQYGQDFGSQAIQNLKQSGSSFEFCQEDKGDRLITDWQISMLGSYQVINASLALAVFTSWMASRQLEIDIKSAQTSLRESSWMGRMEKIHEVPLVYLDGAHNLQALSALKSLIAECFPAYRVSLLYAGLSSKNQVDQVKLLLDMGVDQVQLTTFDHPLAMSEEDFRLVSDDSRLDFIKDWPVFLSDFLANKSKNDLLIVTGSLYFVSDVRAFMKT